MVCESPAGWLARFGAWEARRHIASQGLPPSLSSWERKRGKASADAPPPRPSLASGIISSTALRNRGRMRSPAPAIRLDGPRTRYCAGCVCYSVCDPRNPAEAPSRQQKLRAEQQNLNPWAQAWSPAPLADLPAFLLPSLLHSSLLRPYPYACSECSNLKAAGKVTIMETRWRAVAPGR